MKKREGILGIELGSSKTVAFYLEEGTLPRIGMVPSQGIEKGKITDMDKQERCVREAIINLNIQPLPDAVFLGVSGEVFQFVKENARLERDEKDLEITQKEVQKLLRLVGEKGKRGSGWEVIHVIPYLYHIDKLGPVKNPLLLEGEALSAECLVVSLLSTSYDTYVRCINRCGFNVERIIFLPYAGGEVLLNDEEKELGVALVDIGEGLSHITIYEGGKLKDFKILNKAGRELTLFLAKKFHIPLKEAEKIKKEWGTALRYLSENREIEVKGFSGKEKINIREFNENLEEYLYQWMESLLGIIKPHLPSLNAGLVICGGMANLRGIDEALRNFFSLPVRIALPPPNSPLPPTPQYSTTWAFIKFLQEKKEEPTFSLPPYLKPFIIMINWLREKI